MRLPATPRAGHEKGAIYLEFILTFPIFLIVLFVMMWVGYIFNAKTSLTTSLSRGLRLAITRGDRNLVGGHKIMPIEDWVDCDGMCGPDARLITLLTSEDIDWEDSIDFYNNDAIEVFYDIGTAHIADLPPVYLYSYVYFYQAIKHSIGQSVRYPCDPDDPLDGAGCLRCVFMDNRIGSGGCKDEGEAGGLAGKATPVNDAIGLKCFYQPDVFLLTPIVKLLGFVTGQDNGDGSGMLTIKRCLFLGVPKQS